MADAKKPRVERFSDPRFGVQPRSRPDPAASKFTLPESGKAGVSVSLSTLSSQKTALDVWSLPSTQSSILLSLNTSGELVMSRTLTGTTLISQGYEPRLSSQKGQTITNYLWQYQTDGGSVNDLVYVFYGGSADQQDWDYKLDAEGQCIPAQNPYPTGDAKLTEIIGVDPDGLCDYDSNR